MKDSRLRLIALGLFYLCAVAAIASFVGRTMVTEHDAWLQRSFENRWAFRDVPTKRGAIRDRNGEWLVRDHATSDLEIYYRGFRRGHPCGIVVHCANLVRETAFAMAEDRRRLGRPYTFTRDDVPQAFELCLRLPFSYLERTGTKAEKDRAQDLRFYAAALFGALTDASRDRVGKKVRIAESDGETGAVCVGLKLDPAGLRRVFRARFDELDGFARLLHARVDQGRGNKPFDLWAELARLHERWSEDEAKKDKAEKDEEEDLGLLSMEQVPRTLHRAVRYEDARDFARMREWHPGLRIRPSVVRVRTDHAARWDSLKPFLGAVTPEWGEDSDKVRRELLLAEFRPELEAMAQANDELTEELRESAFAGLRSALNASLQRRGRVGRSGVEGDQDGSLRGAVGMQWVQRGRQAKDLGLWSAFDVSPGSDVFLTIDLRLQNLIEHALDKVTPGHVAAMVVVEPRTGDILAMSSRPVKGRREVKRNKQGVRIHQAEPILRWWSTGSIGSVAKPLILAEHLDARRRGRPFADESTYLFCTKKDMPQGDSKFKRFRLTCDHEHGDLVRDCVRSLGVSCNHYFFQVAEGIGLAGVRAAYDRFGLYRARKAFDAPEDAPYPPPSRFFQDHVPGIPAPDYPNPSWLPSTDIHRRAIGYGVEANVLQIARAYCGLATGRLPELSLVKRREPEIRSVDLGLHPDDLLRVRDGMRFCVEQGTAKDLELSGVWAKTGTAEVESKKERTKNNAWFAGYVGDNPPKLVFTVVVYKADEGRFGASEAGPMIVQFLRELRSNPELAEEFL